MTRMRELRRWRRQFGRDESGITVPRRIGHYIRKAGMQRKADNKPTRCFKHDYYWARHYFRKAVPHGREHLVSLEIAAKSPRGEDLTIDNAWFGSKRPRRIFVHSSG